MNFNTDKYIKALKRLGLSTADISEPDPYWEQVAYEVSSCDRIVIHEDQSQDQFCILEILEINTFIQMCLIGTNEWRLELRITQENGEYIHYYGIEEGFKDTDTISNLGLIIEAFKEFYNGNYQPRNVVWVMDDI